MPKKQKDGRYRAKIKVGTYPNGKPLYKYVSGKTKAELEQNKMEVRRAYIDGAQRVDREMLVCTGIQSWYHATKGNDLAASTKGNLALAINNYINPAIGQKRIVAVTQDDLYYLLKSLEGKGKTLIGDVYSIISGMFNWAAGRGIIDRNPSLGLRKPKSTTNSFRELTENECKALFKLIDATTNRADKLLLMVLYYLGVRRGEALGLQWGDFDFKENTVHIQRDIDYASSKNGIVDSLKTPAADRYIPVPAALRDELMRCPGIGQNFVIQAPKTYAHWPASTFTRHWRELMIRLLQIDGTIDHKATSYSTGHKKRNGEPKDKRMIMQSVLTPHYFRHNYATLLYEADVDVLTAQRYLGHSDPQTTMRIYTHLRNKYEHGQRQKIDSKFALERGKD